MVTVETHQKQSTRYVHLHVIVWPVESETQLLLMLPLLSKKSLPVPCWYSGPIEMTAGRPHSTNGGLTTTLGQTFPVTVTLVVKYNIFQQIKFIWKDVYFYTFAGLIMGPLKNNIHCRDIWGGAQLAFSTQSKIMAYLNSHHCLILYYTILELLNRSNGWSSSNKPAFECCFETTQDIRCSNNLLLTLASYNPNKCLHFRQYLGVPSCPTSCCAHTFSLNLNTGHNEVLYHCMELRTFCCQNHGRLGSLFPSVAQLLLIPQTWLI